VADISSNDFLSYALCYGLMGGSMHGRKFDRAMRQHGYRLKPANEADVIIAHSAGCWLIPKKARPKLIMYIGLPLNNTDPRRTLNEASRLMRQHDTRRNSFHRTTISILYGVIQPRRNIRIIRMAKAAKPIIFPNVPVVFIVNRYDPWLSPELLKQYTDIMPWSFINLPGSHDDVKYSPDRYAEIIDHYAGLLG